LVWGPSRCSAVVLVEFLFVVEIVVVVGSNEMGAVCSRAKEDWTFLSNHHRVVVVVAVVVVVVVVVVAVVVVAAARARVDRVVRAPPPSCLDSGIAKWIATVFGAIRVRRNSRLPILECSWQSHLVRPKLLLHCCCCCCCCYCGCPRSRRLGHSFRRRSSSRWKESDRRFLSSLLTIVAVVVVVE